MGKLHQPRSGSLQFWPRKRAKKFLPSVNWFALEREHSEESGLLGGICYKAGMARCFVKDLTPDSMTKGKQIILPITLVECPPMRIAFVRFYKNSKVEFDISVAVPDKEAKLLRKKLRLPKEKPNTNKLLAEVEPKLNEFSDIRLIVYSLVRLTGIKKTPDIIEIGLAGTINDKFKFVKEHFDKELTCSELLKAGLADIRGLTKGKGTAGPVKRFGISLKQHKSEKGRRRPGSIAPWTPSRVTFRTAMAGQLGLFTRAVYNSKIIATGSAAEMKFEFPTYGKIKTNYIAIKGSVQGAAKRQLLLTLPLRATKKTTKQNFEIIKLLK